MASTNDWWAPVWKGLVWDSQAKHYQTMKSALWLFLYFILCADRSTGCLVRKIKTISSHTGFEKQKILRWMNVLRRNNYIQTKNTGRSLLIQVVNWRKLSRSGKYETPEVTKMRLQKLQKCHLSRRFQWP